MLFNYEVLHQQEHSFQTIRKYDSYEEMKHCIENHNHLIQNYDGMIHEQCEINSLLKKHDGVMQIC